MLPKCAHTYIYTTQSWIFIFFKTREEGNVHNLWRPCQLPCSAGSRPSAPWRPYPLLRLMIKRTNHGSILTVHFYWKNPRWRRRRGNGSLPGIFEFRLKLQASLSLFLGKLGKRLNSARRNSSAEGEEDAGASSTAVRAARISRCLWRKGK